MFDLIYNIDFELIAFLFTFLLFLETRVCYPRENKKNQLFRLMTCMVIVTEGFDILSAFTLTYKTTLPIWLNLIVNSGYFMAGLFLCFMLHYYIEKAIIPADGKSVLLGFNKFFLTFMEISGVFNLFFGYYFSFSSQGEYIHGPLFLMMHAASCWFVLCGSAALIQNRKLLKKPQIISSFLFVLLYFIAVALQTFVCPDILIIMPAASAMLIITIFTLESPDYNQLQKTLQELTETKKALEETNDKYYNLAYTDFMTGLKNRTAYNIQMKQLELLPDKSHIIFMMADINNLKYLNDNLGHMVGDDAIIKAGKLLQKNFEKGCQCYRIGGDEFAVIGYEIEERDFLDHKQSFLQGIKEESSSLSYPFSIASGHQRVGAMTLLEAYKKADEQMYQDKPRSRYRDTKKIKSGK